MNVLVTGGAGYIGSHACVELLNAGHSVVVVDNLVNANAECLRRVERITGKTLEYHEMDLLNRAALNELFDTHRFDCVLHFAGLKAVGESVQQPLRYFNPVGAHPSGLIGEDPRGIPNNLMPYIAQTAAGRREYLSVFGNDYPTPDGTGVRDYLHVVDLARGHVAAMDYRAERKGVFVFNLGTGHGYSVLDMVHAFEKATGKKVPYKIAPRRAGDVAEVYCDPGKAERELGWKAEHSLEDMCRDSWNWQSKNPNGFAG